MKIVEKEISVPVSSDKAFKLFVHSTNEWWPKEYTWSGEQLKEIKMEAKKNGLCTEIGPFGFRCDWGRITKFEESKQLVLKWQISPHRVPEPDPAKASEIEVTFTSQNDSATIVHIEHRAFENHGDGASDYFEAMNSEMGWEYILNKYKQTCLHS